MVRSVNVGKAEFVSSNQLYLCPTTIRGRIIIRAQAMRGFHIILAHRHLQAEHLIVSVSRPLLMEVRERQVFGLMAAYPADI